MADNDEEDLVQRVLRQSMQTYKMERSYTEELQAAIELSVQQQGEAPEHVDHVLPQPTAMERSYSEQLRIATQNSLREAQRLPPAGKGKPSGSSSSLKETIPIRDRYRFIQ